MNQINKKPLINSKGEILVFGDDPFLNEVLNNSKKPVQRLGQGVHNNTFYYGTNLLIENKPYSAVITSDRKVFLAIESHKFECLDCGLVVSVKQLDSKKQTEPLKCVCGNKHLKLIERFNPIKNGFGLNYRVEFNDDCLDYSWSTESIKQYLMGEYEPISLKDLFEKIRGLNQKYIDHLNPLSHDYIACWIIATYCYSIFEQFGRLYNRAEKGSGKTKQAKILRFLCHNPVWITKGTESSIFRDAEAVCPTFIIDNMDKLHEDLKRALEHHIETGWMKEASYSLTNKDTGRTEKYRAYDSLAVNNIYGLDENTIDKTFEIPMLKSINSQIKRLKPTSKSEDWEFIRNFIRYWVLDNWQSIQETYDSLSSDMSGREFDVVEGVLTIAKMIDESLFQSLQEYVKDKISQEFVDLENNQAYMIFSEIYKTFQANPLLQEQNIYLSDIADSLFLKFNPELSQDTVEYSNRKKGFSKYLAKVIRSVPMFRNGGLSGGRTYIYVKRGDLLQYMKLQRFLNEDGHLLTSTTSTTSTTSLTSTDKMNFKVDVVEQVDVVEEKIRDGGKDIK